VHDATPTSPAPCSWSRRAPDAVPCDVLVEVDVELGNGSAWGCGGLTRYPARREPPPDAALAELERFAAGEQRAGFSYEGASGSLVPAAELAVMDAVARAAGVPAAVLFGGVVRTRVPAYASTLAYEDVDGFLTCLSDALRAGFRAVKFHANGDPTIDCETIRASRELVGPEVALIWDAEYAYAPHEAETVGRALDAAGFLWFEAPVSDDASPALPRLAARIATPLVPGAARPRHPGSWAREALAGTWGALRTSVTRMPSVADAVRVIRLSESLDLPCELESFGYGLTGLAHLHAMLATTSGRYFEAPFTPDLLGGIDAPVPVEDGAVSLPAGPGLGHGLTPEAIRGSCELLLEVSV
jgi:L-alanine-DL-glutamate epimerase-like enolase superfamily enzyme